MFISFNKRLMQAVFVAILFSVGTAFAEGSVSSALDLNKVTKILNEKGAEKASWYIYDGGNGEEGARFPAFLEFISSGNSDWFRVLARITSEPFKPRSASEPPEFREVLAVRSVAEALAEHPVKVFEYWHEVLPKNKYFIVNCVAWDFADYMDVHDDVGTIIGKKLYVYPPSYITTPMYRGVLEKRRKAVTTIDGIKLKNIKNQCIEQIDSRLALLKNTHEDKLGLISNKEGKYTYANKDQKHWYNKEELIPLNWHKIFDQKKREDTYKGIREPIWYYRDVYYFLEHATRWPSFMGNIESANQDWLLLLKEVYSLFSYVLPIDRDLALGLAITKDPRAVFSVMGEVLQKGDELKNVCGNTYEDLLWGIAVEEQVIGVAVEKLEARKKSLTNMKDKKLTAMKNQCLKAVDNRLAVWKGRTQKSKGSDSID